MGCHVGYLSTRCPGDISLDVMISSAELLENGPLVVTFYRGIWCPYCRQDLKDLGNAAPDIRSCGASLVAIAHQTVPDSNGKFQRKLGWNFRSSTTLKAMSLWRTGSAGRRRSWRPPKSGSGSSRAWPPKPPGFCRCRRATSSGDGIIVYADINADYRQHPDPCEIVPLLRKMSRAPG